MRIFKVNIILIVLLWVVYSCSGNSAANHSDQVMNKGHVNGIPEISFDTLFYDFGDIYEGEKVSVTFRFRNTGTAELLIIDAFSTCGCTVPEFSKEPVSPGNNGKIEVVFDATNRSGLQNKAITLKTNTPLKEATVWIKANVKSNN